MQEPKSTPRCGTHIVVVTGHRKLSREGRRRVLASATSLLLHPSVDTVIAGGALGVDTVLVDILHQGLPEPAVRHTPLKTLVVVPGRLEQQPKSTWATSRAATELVEMGLAVEPPYRCYLERNVEMFRIMTRLLEERGLPRKAGACLAFSDGGETGGTAHAMGVAKELGYRCTVVPV